MRFFLFGPRVLGVRPGISFSPRDFHKIMPPPLPSGTASRTTTVEGGFVYVIKDQSGRHKIGSSKDPIQRIANLQTGHPEQLDFAWIGAAPEGAYTRIEVYAHDLLKFQKAPAGNEWFAVPASIAIGAVHEAAMRLGDTIQQVQPIQVPQILAVAASQAKQAKPNHFGMLGGLPAVVRWPLSIGIGLVFGLFFAACIMAIAAIAHAG